MALDAAQFVQAVMRQLDAATPAVLAEQMRWKRGTERLVAKWLSGANEPSYRYVMELLAAAGIDVEALLEVSGAKRPLNGGERSAAVQAREEIAALLRRLQELTGT